MQWLVMMPASYPILFTLVLNHKSECVFLDNQGATQEKSKYSGYT